MKIQDNIQIRDSIQIYQDSLYLLLSNRQKCQTLLSKDSLTEEDIIDIFISLHMVLEVSFNALHRQIITHQIVKPIDGFEVIRNIDNIGFIEKTTLFIYNAHFVFDGDLDETAIHHKIIKKMRSFSGIRNKLLHGHSIGSLTIDGNSAILSETKSNLEVNKLKNQIRLFIEINDGMRFFLDHLKNEGWNENFTKDLKKEYLSYDFIPKNFIDYELPER